jgi:hypothetical protein
MILRLYITWKKIHAPNLMLFCAPTTTIERTSQKVDEIRGHNWSTV